MERQLRCPRCHTPYAFVPQLAGQVLVCSGCGAKLRMPLSQALPTVEPAPTPPPVGGPSQQPVVLVNATPAPQGRELQRGLGWGLGIGLGWMLAGVIVSVLVPMLLCAGCIACVGFNAALMQPAIEEAREKALEELAKEDVIEKAKAEQTEVRQPIYVP